MQKAVSCKPKTKNTIARLPRNKQRIASAKVSRSELLAQIPEPVDRETAAQFLRAHCRATVTMLTDHDLLTVTLRQTNAHEHTIKYQYRCELRTDDPAEWERTYIEAAHDCYYVFIDRELEKVK